ncbi:hypothetical protein M569_05599 [Genlisea aurea]|uniref:HTH myb-type domain-containing protein n=1 Tax=Genlisea aurea TaxID=192259 RepID=S8E0H1_9LAMI|nr:hypothetical protein M569_05599 [Genlisea aurea]
MDCVAANSDSSKSSRKLLFLAVEFSEKSLKEFTKKLLKDYIGKTCSSLERAFDLVQKKTIEFEFIICDSRSAASRLDLVEIIGLKHNVLVIIVLDEDEALKMAITVGLRNGAFYCFTTPEDVGKIPSLLSGKRTAPASGRNDDEASGSGLKDCKDGDNSGGIDSYTTPRKKRIVWTDKLHAEFIHAIEKLRKDKEKISPKRILQVMKNSDVTRGQVASHLQKYRLQKGINMQEDSVEYHQNDDVPQPTVQISSTAAAAVEPTGSWVVGNSQTGGGYEGPSSMAHQQRQRVTSSNVVQQTVQPPFGDQTGGQPLDDDLWSDHTVG